MKKLNVHMVSEEVNLSFILNLLSSKKVSTRNKIKHYFNRGDISYIEYLLIKYYDSSIIYNSFKVKFYKVNSKYYYQTNLSYWKVWELISKYRTFYTFDDFMNVNITDLLNLYIYNRDEHILDKDEFTMFTLFLFLCNIEWSSVEKEGDTYKIAIRYPQFTDLIKKGPQVFSISEFSFIEYPITRTINLGCVYIINVWVKLNSNVINYIKSMNVNYKYYKNADYIVYHFKPTLFIIREDIYECKLKNNFSHPYHRILLV